jgi:DNA-binding transcriptional LysR family regulator
VVACAAPSYLDAHGEPSHPRELATHACLAYTLSRTPERWRFAGPAGPFDLRIRPRILSNNGNALMQAAIAGLGVILQPNFIVHEALEDGRLREILTGYPAGSLGVHAVYPHTRLLSAKVRTFIDHLAASFGREGLWET